MHPIAAFYQVHPFVFTIATFGLAYAYVRIKAEQSNDQWQAWNSEGRATNGSTGKPRSPEPGFPIAEVHVALAIADMYVSEGARRVAQQQNLIDEQRGKGLNVQAAAEVLAGMEESLQARVEIQDRLRRQLAEL